jgi:DNA repair protein RecN (Recombination protein N)
MLQDLSIRNFAIIDDLQISFSGGLTILSGETGAGKSIIINAVNLLLGSRATAKLIRSGAETAELEAFFHITTDSRVAKTLEEHGFDPKEGLLVRRIIARQERQRIYINGRLATIQILTSITENLASISGQHVHQNLLKEVHHLLILDQFGGLTSLRNKIYKYFHAIIPLIQELDKLYALKDRQSDHVELLDFQKKEIMDAELSAGEDVTLEKEQKRLRNSEALYQTVHQSIEDLYSSQGAVIERLLEVKKQLEKACQIDPDILSTEERVAQVAFELEDIAEELRAYLKNIQIDEGRLELVEARLDIIQKLKRKYGGSLEATIAHLESIDDELSGIEKLSAKISRIEAKLSEQHAKLVEWALQLSKKRKMTAKILAKKVEKELATLKMAQAIFAISLKSIPFEENTSIHLKTKDQTINETGIDRATFLIAPNVGEDLKPLSSIASGGELSRVILAIKAILAETQSVETIIFDEVDAGIGGGVAEVVGKKLALLANYHQVICITHLPQIAKFGDHHFRISKQVSRGRTKTTILPLGKEERLKEIARMLGGEKITRATRDHARELLEKREYVAKVARGKR